MIPDTTPQPGDTARKPAIPKDATVLVVEDNVSNFVLIARLLGFMGIHCEWKTSGYEEKSKVEVKLWSILTQ